MSLLTRLRSLSLWNCLRITEEGLACLAGLGLHQLSLRGCQQLGNAALQHVAQLSALQQLNLAACERISGATYAQVAEGEASSCKCKSAGAIEVLCRCSVLPQLNPAPCKLVSAAQLLGAATAQPGCLQAYVRGC